jgi:hypothetical protein
MGSGLRPVHCRHCRRRHAGGSVRCGPGERGFAKRAPAGHLALAPSQHSVVNGPEDLRSAVTCRLTPRCSGHHPGVLSIAFASGVDQLWLRSTARPGGAAELIVRYTTLRFLGELPPSRAVGQRPLPLSTVRLAIVGSEVQTTIHYAFGACSTDLRKLRRTPSLQRLQPPNRVDASSNPSLQRTPPGRSPGWCR